MNINKAFLATTLLLSLCGNSVVAQSTQASQFSVTTAIKSKPIKVTGTVLDAAGEPIIGANVVVEPGVRYRVKMSSGVMQVVHSIIQLDGFIPVVPVGPCVKAFFSGSLCRHFLLIPLFRIIKVDFACQLLSRYIVEIVLWIEILRAVIVLLPPGYGFPHRW